MNVYLQVLNQTRDHRQRVLTTVAKELHNWGVMVRKMKAIYHTLNLFNMDVTKKCLIGECWIPIKDLSFIRHTLAEGSVRSFCLIYLIDQLNRLGSHYSLCRKPLAAQYLHF